MKIKRILPIITMVFIFGSCGGGAVSSLVKWRDDNKNLGIDCNVTMTDPGMKDSYVRVGSGPSAHTEVVKTLNGNWNGSEKSDFQKFANDQCQAILSLVKNSLKYNNVQIINPAKVPEGETMTFGKPVKFQDYGQTKFDYVWHMNIAADKTAEPTTSCKNEATGCVNIHTGVKMNYLVEDWSKKDIQKKSIAFQDYMYASCGGVGRTDVKKTVNDLSDTDFQPLTSETLGKCESEAKTKISNLQKDIDNLNKKS